MEPTEINDLLRGLRSPPPGGAPLGPPREPDRSASGEEATTGDETNLDAPPSADLAPASSREARRERRPGPGDRPGTGPGWGRWRLGMVLTKEPHFHYQTAGGERWRVGVFATDRHEVIVAASLSSFTENVHKLRSAFAIAVPSAVILIAFGAWLVSGQAIRPIRRIADTAEKVTASGLSQRIAEPGTGDELHRLTVVLNRMLDRLEDGFKQATRFSADASHELKTPLTIMQGELEAALREAPASSPQQRVYVSQLEEVTRLKRIVSSLLLLSRADAGQLNLTRERIDVSSNFAAICEDAEILADAANITLKSDIEPGLTIMGDRALLQQVFQNLISNAVKYNKPTGSIICRLSRDDSAGNAVFDFENTGDSIPEEDKEKIFRRFHRADAARGRDIDGFGLGLNLALEIARAHSGTLVLMKSDAESTHFRLSIPMAESL
ncbi:MAG: ATP-binding protein [Verrucomicrobiales bacterium]